MAGKLRLIQILKKTFFSKFSSYYVSFEIKSKITQFSGYLSTEHKLRLKRAFKNYCLNGANDHYLLRFKRKILKHFHLRFVYVTSKTFVERS